MASHTRVRATQPTTDAPPSKTGTQPRRLQVARAPAAARRSIGDIGTLLAVGLFAVCLALAALHAVLVENQASLDDLIQRNQQSQEQIDKLQAEIAYLDSPEGLAEQAQSVGLVPAAELAVLTPVGPGLLPPPVDDPFSLASSRWSPAEPSDPIRPPAAAPASRASEGEDRAATTASRAADRGEPAP